MGCPEFRDFKNSEGYVRFISVEFGGWFPHHHFHWLNVIPVMLVLQGSFSKGMCKGHMPHQ